MTRHENMAFRDLEHWPLSENTSQRQIEGWEIDEDNVNLNEMSVEDRLAFLAQKHLHLDRGNTARYFKKLGVPIHGKVLEQGAGICWLASYLSGFDSVDEIVSVELSEQRIRSFRELTTSFFPNVHPEKIRYVVGDMHRIDVPDGTFDLVVCDAVLHHADNLVAMLRESWRVLKPGGWFVALREPTIPYWRFRDPIFHSRYPEGGTAYYRYKAGWKGAFLNAWFVNIQIKPFIEYGLVRGRRMSWPLRRLLAWADRRRHVYPKICIAGQKPR